MRDTTDYDADPYFLLMGEADSAMAAKDWQQAAARLNDALKVRPDAPTNALLLNNLASAYIMLGADSLAMDSYNRSLEIAPSMTASLLGRAKLHLHLQQDVLAYRDFETVLQIDSISTEALFYHGLMALYAGGLETANADIEALRRIAPKAYNTTVACASLYSLTGREEQAIPLLEKLIENDPSAEFFASLAGCHLQLGQLTEASEIIGRGLKLYPNDPELYYYRAWLNRDRYRRSEAETDARKAVELGASPIRVAELFK